MMDSRENDSIDEEAVARSFFDVGLSSRERTPVPGVDEVETASLDEWYAASLTARLYTAERTSHLGGPQERVVAAMPARTVSIKRRAVVEEPEPEPIPRAPSEEERNRTARRTTEARAEQESPGMVLFGVALLIGLVTFFVFIFGARLSS